MNGLHVVALLAAVAGLAAGPGEEVAPRPRTIVIDGHRPRIAVSPCASNPATTSCEAVVSVLRDDIEFEGLFELTAGPADLGVEVRSGAGGSIEARVRTVIAGPELLARSYPVPSDAPWRAAHRIADDITALTQYRGVASSHIAFVSDRDAGGNRTKDVYASDYDGHDLERRTVARQRQLNILPAWSPIGDALAFVGYAPFPDVYVVPAKGGRTNLTQGRGDSFAPAWSPDGRQIAFHSSRTGDNEIWVIDRDGSRPRQLTSGATGTAPTWSPTGREIAFTSARTGSPQIWIADADGLNLRKLRIPGDYLDAPAWNPAREYGEIAFASRVAGSRMQVSVFTLPDGPVRTISDPSLSCESPAWAPNGRHLVFPCQMPDGWQLLITDREGHVQRTLTSGQANNQQPDWGP